MEKPQVFLDLIKHRGLLLLQWVLLSLVVGALAGSASAWLLLALEWATDYREAHTVIIWALPVAGIVVGLLYHYYGADVVKGNNQIIEEALEPQKIIPLKMAPLVFIGTVATHLFGGSAGREGTAVQMGGAIADQFSSWFGLRSLDRKILLAMGVGAGFASLFGTPVTGAVFALEVLIIGRMRYEALLPAFMASIVANYVADLWPIAHTHYHISEVPHIDLQGVFWTLVLGVVFGLTARLFSKATHFWGNLFKKYVGYPPMRPFIGGAIIALIVYLMGTTKFIGLGIPTIVASFEQPMGQADFLIKILLTSFTLGAGFKGGEVTPLFFIGATLGSAMVWLVPLPVGLLAGMGFVAVFAGATNTPLACLIMGVELFGAESIVYTGLACVMAYLSSGHSGIYGSQRIGSPKWRHNTHKKGQRLG
ncbi:voltage-gated chloride channel family protein [Sediminicola luteus]|uniref:Chloride channel protein n=1 Tax=Sediminicola luteus TaxID=319238 RepID=A0A2A4G9M4_9FLAO|nr:voltage-gated chloride channel family protein [Sediminicola luteus]PCE64465.1 chloride channel protein [Sediminicola luteus]